MDEILPTSEGKSWHYHWFLKIIYNIFRWTKQAILFGFKCPLFHFNITNFPVSDTKWWMFFYDKKFPLTWQIRRYLFPIVNSCDNVRRCCSKWNSDCILINFFVKTYLTVIFCDIISENKRFALDKQC